MLVLVVVGGLLSAASALSSPPGMSFSSFFRHPARRAAHFSGSPNKIMRMQSFRPSGGRSECVCLIETEIRRRLSPPSE
jgi:hypothetical protein